MIASGAVGTSDLRGCTDSLRKRPEHPTTALTRSYPLGRRRSVFKRRTWGLVGSVAAGRSHMLRQCEEKNPGTQGLITADMRLPIRLPIQASVVAGSMGYYR